MKPVAPEEVGLSSKRLKRLDTLIQHYIDEQGIPGVLMLIARHGKLAYSKPFGLMDIATHRSTQLDTIYRIYSMTKPVTCAAVMMLHEEGHFALSDPISDYIPEFADTPVYVDGKQVPPERPITIQHLLTHTSGLVYAAGNSPVEQMNREADLHGRDVPLAEWVKRLAALPLMHHPGTVWHYGPSIDVLGYLVEVVAGIPFAEFLRTRIFQPLGMLDTDFYVPPAKLDRLATLYGEGLWVTDTESLGDYTQPPVWESGGGGLVSTGMDFLRFAQMLLNGGELDGVRLLGRKTVSYMTTNQLLSSIDRSRRQRGYGYGFGVDVLLDPVAAGRVSSVGEYGWSGGLASTHFWVDPVEDLVAVKMTQIVHRDEAGNDVPHRDMNTDLRTAVYQALIDEAL